MVKCEPGCMCKRHTKSPEAIQKQSESLRGKPGNRCEKGCTCKRHSRKPRTEEEKHKISESVKKAYQTDPTYRKKVSEAARRQKPTEKQLLALKAGSHPPFSSDNQPEEIPFKWGKGRFLHGDTHMRSSWEVKCAEMLDSLGVAWDYEPERFRLWENGQRSYTPDFYLPEFDVWLEVKGFLYDKCRDKISAFRGTGRTLLVIQRDDLFTSNSQLLSLLGNR